MKSGERFPMGRVDRKKFGPFFLFWAFTVIVFSPSSNAMCHYLIGRYLILLLPTFRPTEWAVRFKGGEKQEKIRTSLLLPISPLLSANKDISVGQRNFSLGNKEVCCCVQLIVRGYVCKRLACTIGD